MSRTRKTLLVAALLAVTGLVAACGGGDDDSAGTTDTTAAGSRAEGLASETALPIQELDVVVPGGDTGEFSFTATPATLTAGPVEVSLTNHGTLEHQAMLMKFKPGADFAKFAAAAAADPSGTKALALVEGYGGPNAAVPGETRTATQVLEAGDYMVICVLPGEDGAPHAAHGMVLPFTVKPGDVEVTAETPTGIDADRQVELVDFGFKGAEGTFEPGETIHILNSGEQAHEFVAYRLNDGVSVADFKAAMTSAAGAPPATAGTGTGALAPGRAADITLPDEPGRYVLFCMLPDVAGDSQPHLAHGMVAGMDMG
jgi:uncharacterized cupredoxin-like copper-binding protein